MSVANGSQLISSREAKKGHAQALPGVGVGMVRVVAGETLGGLPNRTQGIWNEETLLSAFVALAAASAGAADMSLSPVYAPPPMPVYSWTGIYFGGNVGYSWGQSKSDRTGSLVGLGVNVRESQEVDGVIGGVQTG